MCPTRLRSWSPETHSQRRRNGRKWRITASSLMRFQLTFFVIVQLFRALKWMRWQFPFWDERSANYRLVREIAPDCFVIWRPPSTCDQKFGEKIPAVFTEAPRSSFPDICSIWCRAFSRSHFHSLSVESNEFVDLWKCEWNELISFSSSFCSIHKVEVVWHSKAIELFKVAYHSNLNPSLEKCKVPTCVSDPKSPVT